MALKICVVGLRGCDGDEHVTFKHEDIKRQQLTHIAKDAGGLPQFSPRRRQSADDAPTEIAQTSGRSKLRSDF